MTIQELCARGQDELERMEYLRAEKSLAEAEALALTARDWDSLARLYMPLQEARRQRRQRCGEGIIRLDLSGRGIQGIQHGQILVSDLKSAIAARREVERNEWYLDVLLGDVRAERIVHIAALEDGSGGFDLRESELPAPTYGNVMHLWERLHEPYLAKADAMADSIEKIEAYRTAIRVDYACELAHQNLAESARRLIRPGSSLPARDPR